MPGVMAGSQSEALPRWVALTVQSHFTTSMHFYPLQNPPSLIVQTASNIPSNLYNPYLQEHTHAPPPKPPTALHPRPAPSSQQSCRPLNLSLKYSTFHKHIHPHHRLIRPAPGVSSKRCIHRSHHRRHSGYYRHRHHQMSSRASASSADMRARLGPKRRGVEG